MRVGIAAFNGDRLREARQVRGLTATSLADLAGVKAASISNYENHKTKPSADVLDSLALRLNVPAAFLMLPSRSHPRGTVFNRSLSATTKMARDKGEGRFRWIRDLAVYLSDYVQLPAANFPVLNLPGPELMSMDQIEDAAARLRDYWNLRPGPISNVIALLENQGAIVARDKLGSETLESASEYVPGERPYIIIGTDKGTAVRWRFDASHELGHLIVHQSVPPELIKKLDHHKAVETQAHRFAAAFLLPAAEFGDDLFSTNLDALRSLKHKWNVSIAMMIKRMSDLDFINEETARRLWINYSRRKWRTMEPGDESSEPERPRLLRRAIEMVLDGGLQTPDDICDAVNIPASDIESLTGLPPGFLDAYSRVLPGPDTATADADDDRAPAEVVQLPLRRRV